MYLIRVHSSACALLHIISNFYLQVCCLFDFTHQLYGIGPDNRGPLKLTVISVPHLLELLTCIEHVIVPFQSWEDSKSSTFVAACYEEQVRINHRVD